MHLRSSYLAWPNFIDFLHTAQDTLNPLRLFKSVYGIHLSRKSVQVGGGRDLPSITRTLSPLPSVLPVDRISCQAQEDGGVTHLGREAPLADASPAGAGAASPLPEPHPPRTKSSRGALPKAGIGKTKQNKN